MDADPWTDTTDVGPAPPLLDAGGRFALGRKLGSGGFGVVYEAHDRERGERVALKVLHDVDPDALYRFKKEFRVLSGVAHRNLVTLHELFAEGKLWFFTMELLSGSTFIEGVGGDPVAVQARIASRRAPFWFDEERLRPALAQLAHGVGALHDRGIVHRDLKPTNVIVARDGRVVVLDFGLATELRPRALEASAAREVVGTYIYMAPEQTRGGGPPVAASDWYAVGVMLYEALTGRRPFEGTIADVLIAKLSREPPPPDEVAPGLPPDLARLCADLLRRAPERRPDAREVIARLESRAVGRLVLPPEPAAHRGRGAGAASAAGAGSGDALVGREAELAALEAALDEAASGRRAVAVRLHGPSGIGKSALAWRFLDGVAARREGAVVLAGRCYEREAVPFKAADGLVDALTRELRRLRPDEEAALVPPDVFALARLFPVLGRVRAVARTLAQAPAVPDPQELRRRAFLALRELLARLAARGPVVLLVDDLQWGDLDGAALLQELLRPPGAPPLLLVLAYRCDEEATGPAIDFLRAAAAREVRVGPLAPDQARAVARALLGEAANTLPAGPAHGEWREDALVDAIARESGGNPLHMGELARWVREEERSPAGLPPGLEVALEQVIRARIARLPAPARLLLEVIAVAGRPLPKAVVAASADLDAGALAAALVTLRTAHLVRKSAVTRPAATDAPGATEAPAAGPEDDEAVETAHDRIREAAVATLAPADAADRHRRLAAALEATPGADPEALAAHLRAAGESGKAAAYIAAAARNAAAALAFDRAARLYRLALELAPAANLDRTALRSALGDALANAGRGPEAAAAYLDAAQASAGDAAVDLERRAADQLLRSGHVDRGLEIARRVAASSGMRLPRTDAGALLSLLARRVWLRLRGLDFRERAAGDVPPADLVRIDIAWSLCVGLSGVDPIRGFGIQARHLLLALRAGEPYRVARALALEAAYWTAGGRATRRRTAASILTAEALAQRCGHPHAIALARTIAGLAAFVQGRWRRTRELCDQAERLFHDQCSGAAWEIATGQLFALWSLYYGGAGREFQRRVRALADEAEERGDLYAAANARAGVGNAAWLLADDPAGAERALDLAIGRWSQRGYHLQHLYDLFARCQIDLYTGRAGTAWRRIAADWPAVEAAHFLRIQHTGAVMRHLRARCAVGAAAAAVAGNPGAAGDAEAARLLDVAERDAARIERDGADWSEALARLVRGGAAAVGGDRDAAVTHFRAAAAGLDDAQMELFGAAAALRLGAALGGDEGRSLEARARASFAGEAVVSPERTSDLLAPSRRLAG